MSEESQLSFEQFWTWIQQHPNCIIRVGSPDALLYDHDDYHWAFGVEKDATVVIQMLKGKRTVAEIFIDPSEIGAVTSEPAEHDEYLFQLKDREEKVLFYFAMSHALDEAENPAKVHWN